MVVERSNAQVYLMTSVLELKVEGSNPGHCEKIIFILECREKNATLTFGMGGPQFKIRRQIFERLFTILMPHPIRQSC